MDVPRLEGGPYCFWCLHFKFFCLEELVQIAQVEVPVMIDIAAYDGQ